MHRKHRVLIVENESRWREELSELLEGQGFEVEAVGTAMEAMERFKTNFYHFAVLDIRLDDDSDPSDDEGFNILQAVKTLGLQKEMSIVMLSAFGTREQLREAFAQHGVANFLDKAEFDDQEFPQQVRRIIKEKTPINLDLVLHWPSNDGAEQQVSNLKLDGNRVKSNPTLRKLLALELEDLLCRLFSDADRLMIESMTPGYSGSSVLRVTPSYVSGTGQPVVVKFGDPKQIEDEYRNFRTHVQNFIGGARSTTVLTRRRTSHLGGIVYQLLGSTDHRLESFGHFYPRATLEHIREALTNLFLKTCEQWYANPGKLQFYDLSAEYMRTLNLTPGNLEQSLHDLKSAQGKEKLHFSSLTQERAFTNPIPIATTHPFVKSTYVCTTHGDLNESNFLIDKTGHTWLIDFGRTGAGHILRDVAELDAIVRIQLLAEGEATLEERLRMEELLCQPNHFSDLPSITNALVTQNPALVKAYATTLHLRSLAHKLVERRPGDDLKDYYIALIYYALGYLRYYALSRLQREHALLSASLLMEQI